jgi:hypothetical protein
LARPGGNAGFEYGMTWVAVLRDSFTTAGIGQLAAIQRAAPSFRVELRPLVLGDSGDIEPAIAGSKTAQHHTQNGVHKARNRDEQPAPPKRVMNSLRLTR